ncbi:MAG: hypothetical protein C5B50_23885 [Verrucomicrobia bacterium]|nr:MAG: hypothetical protein C5B50_23885 [Verrucomicrobiota bacterium]
MYEVRGQRDKGRGNIANRQLPIANRRRGDLPSLSSLPSLLPVRGEPVLLSFGRGDVAYSRIRPGDKAWKTSDPELEGRIRESFAGDAPRFRRPIAMEAHGVCGKPLTLIARDELGHVAQAESAMPLATAQRQPLATDRLRAQLGRLGGTQFRLGELRNFLGGDVLLPVSELNRLRREIVQELATVRAKPPRWTLHTPQSTVHSPQSTVHSPQSTVHSPQSENHGAQATDYGLRTTDYRLILLVRTMAQLEATLECGISTVYCDFEDPKKYRDAVALFRQRITSDRSDGAIFVAPPRIFKSGEEWTLKQVRASDADGYLVRNYDHLRFFAKDRRIGDYSLNIANRLSADYFKNRFGLERLTASYDLNHRQLEALLRSAPPEWFEITLHQHIPMFHMEHCVFCAFLSNGTDYTNCGRPCDQHQVRLRDRAGAEHPVKADAGCRNTVFNGRAQTGAEHAASFMALGARHFRIELLDEDPSETARTISIYRRLLKREVNGAQVWRELKATNQLGVTRGTML